MNYAKIVIFAALPLCSASLWAAQEPQVDEVPLVELGSTTTELQARQVGTEAAIQKDKDKAAGPGFQQQLLAQAGGFSLDTALDVSTAGQLPMASTRMQLSFFMPLLQKLQAGFGLRAGYSLHSFKGAVYDAALGSDANAILALHAIPVMAVASLGYSSGEALIFGKAARSSLYAGLGSDVFFGQAQAFGRSVQLLQAQPAWMLGAALAIQHSPGLNYGLFAEWQHSQISAADLPGISTDMSMMRVGLRVAFAFAERAGGSHE